MIAVHRAENTTQKLGANEVAELLDEMARRLELAGVSKFKVRAYENAAVSLRMLLEPLDQLVAEYKLKSIHGVGDAIAEKIASLHRTGTHPSLEQLRQQGPSSLLELVRIPGVGPKRAQALFEKLKITNVEELRLACEQNRLADTKGFGKHMQSKVLANLDFSKTESGLIRLNRATARANATVETIQERYPALTQVIPAGDVRRGCELCKGLVFAVTGPDELIAQIKALNNPALIAGLADQFGATLIHATGSELHVSMLAQRAQQRGFALTRDALTRQSKALRTPTEQDVYAALGLKFIEPELREGLDEIELAAENRLPNLVTENDLRGALHCHTNFSDGVDTLADMTSAAAKRGLDYFGVCDHSQSAFYAGGLKFEKVLAQHQLADAINADASNSCHVFKGIESEILRDGSLDFAPQHLGAFDFVVASMHNRFGLSRDEQTARILKAVSNPFTTILGHPTGRLLLSRREAELDLEAILKACAAHDVTVEINGDPHRMDLDWRWHRRALELGCRMSINPDAHDTLALSYLKWGTLVARKGGVAAARVLNCLSLDAISKHFNRRKQIALRKESHA